MIIYTSAKRCYEQYLNGDCSDIGKLKIQILDHEDRAFLRVHTVESCSDGTLRIIVDTSKENANGQAETTRSTPDASAAGQAAF